MPELPTVVAAVVTSARGVLLGRRHDGNPPWTFPGGAQEPGETHFDAAFRECLEETGLAIITQHEIGDRIHPLTGRRMVYIAAIPENNTNVIIGSPRELSEVRWFNRTEAIELLPNLFEPVATYLFSTLPR